MRKCGKDYWALKFDKCVVCNSKHFKHEANGYCSRCYNRKRASRYRNKILFGGHRESHLENNPICGICLRTKDLVVHHKDGNRKNVDKNNFCTLCRSCHSRLHILARFRKRYKEFEGLIHQLI